MDHIQIWSVSDWPCLARNDHVPSIFHPFSIFAPSASWLPPGLCQPTVAASCEDSPATLDNNRYVHPPSPLSPKKDGCVFENMGNIRPKIDRYIYILYYIILYYIIYYIILYYIILYYIVLYYIILYYIILYYIVLYYIILYYIILYYIIILYNIYIYRIYNIYIYSGKVGKSCLQSGKSWLAYHDYQKAPSPIHSLLDSRAFPCPATVCQRAPRSRTDGPSDVQGMTSDSLGSNWFNGIYSDLMGFNGIYSDLMGFNGIL